MRFFRTLFLFALLAGLTTIGNASSNACTAWGATVNEKIASAIASLPATGGLVDASCFGSATVYDQINVGDGTKPVTLRVPSGVTWYSAINDPAKSVFKVFTKSAIVSDSFGNGYGGGLTVVLNAGTSVASIITNDQTVGGSGMTMRLEGLFLYNNNNATVANAMVDLSGLFDQSELKNINISTFSGRGLWMHDGISATTLYNVVIDGSWTAGARPLVIETTTSSTHSISVLGGSVGHPGAGQYVIELNGHGGSALGPLHFFGSLVESSNSDTTTPGIRVVDAKGVTFDGLMWNNIPPGGTSAYGIELAETSSAKTRGFVCIGCFFGPNKAINDTIRSITTNRTYLNYTFQSPGDAGDFQIFGGLALSNTGIHPDAYGPAGFHHKTQTTGSCATTGCSVTITYSTAFPDTSYTASCTVEDSTAQSETAGLRVAKIRSKTAGSVIVDLDNLSGAAVTGTLDCVMVHQ